MKRYLVTFFFASLALLISSGAHSYDLRYPPVRWMADLDRALQPTPQLRHAYDPLDGFLSSTDQRIQALTSAASGMESVPTKYLPGLKVEAIDTNNFEEVADSSWFTNRIGRNGITPEDVAARQSACNGILKGQLAVRETAAAGDTPALMIEESSGSRYILHPDAPDAHGMASARATAASLILYAAGYNAAQYCPVEINKSALAIAGDAQRIDAYGKRSQLTPESLGQMLARQPDRIRAAAVRMPDGLPTGRFAFAGRLFIDKNDRLRHQDRRELRGLRAFSAFIGWANISWRTTYDAFVEGAPGKGYIQHWLLNLTDIDEPGMPPNPVGSGASTINEAFALMTARDAFWATRLIALFDDPLIDAIVAASKYSEHSGARADAQGLKSRRDAIAKKWFGVQSPLDDFAISSSESGVQLTCSDLARKTAATAEAKRLYRARLMTPYERATVVPWRDSSTCAFTLDKEALQGLTDGRIYELDIQAKDASDEWWLPAVKVLVRPRGGSLAIEGLLWQKR